MALGRLVRRRINLHRSDEPYAFELERRSEAAAITRPDAVDPDAARLALCCCLVGPARRLAPELRVNIDSETCKPSSGHDSAEPRPTQNARALCG